MNSKVLVVDDHEVARMGISHALADSEFEVVEYADSGKQAVSLLAELVVDAVLLDVRMPSGDGLAALETIRSSHENLPVVILSAYDNPTYIARATALGANDYILKNGISSDICDSLRRSISGTSPPLGSRMIEIRNQLSQEIDSRKLPKELPLTGRESQVLVHIALGLSNKEIAQSLEISVETVKEHVQNILRKIQANDRTDAAVRAVRLGLVD